MILAAILFGLASLGGVAMVAMRLRGANPPIALAFGHGLLAASGLVVLVIAVIGGASATAGIVAIAAFVLAAGIGFWMVRQHLAGRLIPIAGVFLHGLAVLFGWAALLAHFVG